MQHMSHINHIKVPGLCEGHRGRPRLCRGPGAACLSVLVAYSVLTFLVSGICYSSVLHMLASTQWGIWAFGWGVAHL